MKGFRKLLNQIRLAWISLISKIKSFFSSTSLENDHIEETLERNKNKINLEDEQEVWYDALTELDEEE